MDIEDAKEILKEKYEDFKDLPNHIYIDRFLNEHIELKNFLYDFFNKNKQYLTIYKLIKCLVKDIKLTKCKICGKELTYNQTIANGYYCSKKCFSQDKDANQKREKAKEKTNLQKYGASTVFELKEYQDKFKEIHLQNYGTEVVSKSLKIKEKMIVNCKKAMQQYGIKKSKETILTKYGVENPLQLEKTKEAHKKISFKKAYNNFSLWKDFVIPLFSIEDYHGYDNIYKWKCVKCGNIFESKIYTTSFNDDFLTLPRCRKCFPLHEHFSKPEKELVEFCKEYFPNLIENDRVLLNPYELDIVIPEIKLAIEFNGIYWHAVDKVESGYHLMKTEMCEKLGYRLIYIWEDDWENNQEEIKKKLIDIFENKEIIDYNQLLDRCWYPLKQIDGYSLEILPPEIININNYLCENCGYLKYIKND